MKMSTSLLFLALALIMCAVEGGRELREALTVKNGESTVNISRSSNSFSNGVQMAGNATMAGEKKWWFEHREEEDCEEEERHHREEEEHHEEEEEEEEHRHECEECEEEEHHRECEECEEAEDDPHHWFEKDEHEHEHGWFGWFGRHELDAQLKKDQGAQVEDHAKKSP